MPDNVFAGLDEIIERQKKAEQDAEKRTNDILTALSQSNQVNATVKKSLMKQTSHVLLWNNWRTTIQR